MRATTAAAAAAGAVWIAVQMDSGANTSRGRGAGGKVEWQAEGTAEVKVEGGKGIGGVL